MKKLPLLLLTLVAILCGAFGPRSASAAASFSFFYDSLEPYGEWVEVGEYGDCWRPNGVDADWAPYTDGYWAYTDSGWTWVSYEDFGGITYHYGRWANVEDEGWCWVPDYEWAPAWVSWRSSDDHVGWAPLPPRATFTASIGISTWADREYDIGPRYYNFCSVRDFGSPALRPVIIDRSRNVTIINKTVNITNITVRGDRNIVYNGGPRYDVISRRSARPIQTLKLVQKTDVDMSDVRANRFLARQQGNQLIVAAPRVERPSEKFKPKRASRVIQNAKVDTGWNKIKDQKQKQALRQQFAEQATGKPQDAPAKAIDPQDVKIVEERANEKPVAADAPEQVVGGKAARVARKNAEAAAERGEQPAGGGQGKAGAGKNREKMKRGAAAQEIPATEAASPQPSITEVTPPAAVAKGKNGRGKANPGVVPPPVVPVPDADTTAQPAGDPAVATPKAGRKAGRNGGREGAELQPFKRAEGQPDAIPVPPGDAADENASRARALQQQRNGAQRGQNGEAAAARQQAIRQQQREAARQNVPREQAVERPQPDEASAARQQAIRQQQREAVRQNVQREQSVERPRPDGAAAARQRALQRQQQPQGNPRPPGQVEQKAPEGTASAAPRGKAKRNRDKDKEEEIQ